MLTTLLAIMGTQAQNEREREERHKKDVGNIWKTCSVDLSTSDLSDRLVLNLE